MRDRLSSRRAGQTVLHAPRIARMARDQLESCLRVRAAEKLRQQNSIEAPTKRPNKTSGRVRLGAVLVTAVAHAALCSRRTARCPPPRPGSARRLLQRDPGAEPTQPTNCTDTAVHVTRSCLRPVSPVALASLFDANYSRTREYRGAPTPTALRDVGGPRGPQARRLGRPAPGARSARTRNALRRPSARGSHLREAADRRCNQSSVAT